MTSQPSYERSSIPIEAIRAAAQVLLDNYSSEYQNDFDWTEFADQAVAVLEAAMPHLGVSHVG